MACLFAGGVLGILAIQQATEISVYHHARACLAGAPSDADCLQAVEGSVAGVAEFPGSGRVSADYALDVRTASTTLHLTFSSDSPMLGYAVDGDPALVTMWRGVPVSVVTDGRSAVTTSVPDTALASDLGSSEVTGGVGVLFVLGARATRRNRRAGGAQPLTRPVLPAALLALGLGGIVVVIGGVVLGGKPSRLGPDLAATSGVLVAVLGLSAWLGISAKRRESESPASLARAQGMANDALDPHTPVLPAARPTRSARTPLRTRMHPVNWARVLGARAAAYLPVLLTAAVLFGVFLTSQDGPPARAFRHAPACVGETNLATCVGDFTAVINGVRGPANGAEIAYVSYVTSDGAINTWARFDGDAATIARMASADENARTNLRIRVWRRSIVGAELGGSWHWADGNPPGNTVPAVFLAVSFALLLLVVRLRIHRRAGAVADSQRLLVDDLGQVAAAAGSVVLLAYGFWPGAVLALAVLLWLSLSVRRSMQFKRLTLAALHSS
ncbi:MAG TPA: hypothetical protein VF940_02495 [Streptosporangiaceae bacterium]